MKWSEHVCSKFAADNAVHVVNVADVAPAVNSLTQRVETLSSDFAKFRLDVTSALHDINSSMKTLAQSMDGILSRTPDSSPSGLPRKRRGGPAAGQDLENQVDDNDEAMSLDPPAAAAAVAAAPPPSKPLTNAFTVIKYPHVFNKGPTETTVFDVLKVYFLRRMSPDSGYTVTKAGGVADQGGQVRCRISSVRACLR